MIRSDKFGEDKKYLENIKVEVYGGGSYYIPEKKTIKFGEEEYADIKAHLHEYSHAIVDEKYKIWDEITKPFYEKYLETLETIINDVCEEMHERKREKWNEARKLYDIYDKINPIKKVEKEFEEQCLKEWYYYKGFYDILNELSRKIAERFEKYGYKVKEFVNVFLEIKGLDELVAHAIAEQTLGSGDFYQGLYLFEGSLTIYKIREEIKKNGYPSVTDKLFLDRVKYAKRLLEDIM